MADETNTTETETSTETTTEVVETVETKAEETAEETVLGTVKDEEKVEETAETKAEEKAVEKDEGLPENYELKVTAKNDAGEDVTVEIDPVLLEKATPVFKELGLGNEQANQLAALVPEIQSRILQQQNDEFATVKTQWAKDAQEDAEIGGKNWKATQSLSARALDTFVGPAVAKDEKTGEETRNPFRQMLDDTGLGNHPEMIRAFRKIGEAISEDGTFARGQGAVTKKSREEVMYPDDVPKT